MRLRFALGIGRFTASDPHVRGQLDDDEIAHWFLAIGYTVIGDIRLPIDEMTHLIFRAALPLLLLLPLMGIMAWWCGAAQGKIELEQIRDMLGGRLRCSPPLPGSSC